MHVSSLKESHQINPLENNRIRLAKAYIEFCRNRHSGKPQATVLLKGKAVIIENLTIESVCSCLIHCLEVAVYCEYGSTEGYKVLVSSYQHYMNKDSSKLTLDGIDAMNEVIKEAVKLAIEAPKDNNFGIEIVS